MIARVNSYDQHVGARILDFFHSRTPWHRGLWNVGLVVTLAEVLEASEAVRAGVLSEEALAYLVSTAQRQVGFDPGAGGASERPVLQAALKSKLRPHGLDYHTVAQLLDTARASYFARWSRSLAGPNPPRAERTARAIASHLLDVGFSPDFLHRWWSYRLRHAPTEQPLAEVVAEADELATAKPKRFEILVAVESELSLEDGTPRGWLTAPQVLAWLADHAFDGRGVHHKGGFLFEPSALDADAAAAAATELIDRLTARVAVVKRAGLKPLDQLWIKGEAKARRMNRRKRGVWVTALQREQQLYSTTHEGTLDAAIGLLSHMQSSSPGAAVAGGWAAIEALLGEAGDRGGAADRLAMLVACSFPRAELTALSYAAPRTSPRRVATTLAGAETNRDRAAAFASALQSHDLDETTLEPSDRAAATRMRDLLARPDVILKDIHDHATVAFRRFYRQRNLVLHSGKTDAVALRASLRTAAPLVGAGMDRIVHAHYVDGLKPLELAARARIALETLTPASGPSCIDLLG